MDHMPKFKDRNQLCQTTDFEVYSSEFKWVLRNCQLTFSRTDEKFFQSQEFMLTHSRQRLSLSLHITDVTVNKNGCLKVHIKPCRKSVTLIVTVEILGENLTKSIKIDPYSSKNESVLDFNFRCINVNVKGNALTFLCKVKDLEETCSLETLGDGIKFLQEVAPFKMKMKVKNFSALYKNQQLCDVTFVIGHIRIKAHSLILGTVSPYFLAMFCNSGMKEQTERLVDLTDDPDVTEEVFLGFLDYVYGLKSVEEMKSIAKKLLILSDKYLVKELTDSCQSFFCESLNVNNVLSLLLLADKYDFKLLKEKALEVTRKNIDVVRSFKEFQELSKHGNLILALL